MSHEHDNSEPATRALEKRAHWVDRAVVIGMALVTAVLSTYYTNVITIGEVQSELKLHKQEIVNLKEEVKETSSLVDRLRIDTGGEAVTKVEIMRRLESIERTQSELMKMLGRILQDGESAHRGIK